MTQRGAHRNLEFAFWANEQAFGSSILLLVGGLIGVIPYQGFDGKFKQFEYYWAGILSLIVGLYVFLVEYPRGMRTKGSLVERRGQACLAKFVSALGPLTRNYFARFALYFVFGVPCCCLITTLLGGAGLVIASIIYLVAGIKGEHWKSPAAAKLSEPRPANSTITEAPQAPPPRRPVSQGAINLAVE